MNKAVFIDRDGTMAGDVGYCSRVDDFELFPYTAKAIRLLNRYGFKVIVVTNQSGVGRGYFTEETLAAIHSKMKEELAKDGAMIDGIYYCLHHPNEKCDCRKPKPKLVLQAVKDFNIDLKQSFVVGDAQMDIDLGKAVGCGTIAIGDRTKDADFVAFDLMEAAGIILGIGVET